MATYYRINLKDKIGNVIYPNIHNYIKIDNLTGSINLEKGHITVATGIYLPKEITTHPGRVAYCGSDLELTDITQLRNYKTYIGALQLNSQWKSVISVRHRNGSGDGSGFGLYLMSDLTSVGDLVWRKQINSSTWDNEKIILDNSNFSNYSLPLTGGTLSGNLKIIPNWDAVEEGGEIGLYAPTSNPALNGINIDNYQGSFRIFGQPSADGKTFTTVGTPLTINPYTRDIRGDYHYYADGIYNKGSYTWKSGKNFYLEVENGNKEWSFDLGMSLDSVATTDTGCYAQFWSSRKGTTIAAFYNDDCSVEIPNGNLKLNHELQLNSNIRFNETGATSGNWRGIYGRIGDNDSWTIRGCQTGSNAGFLEIATGDDGTEPIYVRQYSPGNVEGNTPGTNVTRTITLLSASGNTSFPGHVSAPCFNNRYWNTFRGSAGKPCWVKLGHLSMGNDSASALITVLSGGGWNGNWNQNTKIEIMIKNGFQETASSTKAYGVCLTSYYNTDNNIKVQVRCTNNYSCDVWIYLPWGYWDGNYIVEGWVDEWQHSGAYQTSEPTEGVLQSVKHEGAIYSRNCSVKNIYADALSTWNNNNGSYDYGTVMFCWT